MIELGLSDTSMAFLGLALIILMFALFVSERYPAEVIAISAAALMLVFGMLPYDAALTVLSNPAPWTIIAMFLIMGGLVRTGALEWLTQHAEAQASRRPKATLVILLVLRGVGIGLHEQHAGRCGDDPGFHSGCPQAWA